MRVDVWAPRARRVAVVPEGGHPAAGPTPLAPDPERDGWYVGTVGWLGPGADYRLALDDDALMTDPRARWLPYGVHGPARVWDPASFAWSDGGWEGRPLERAGLVYELHIGTFTAEGTLDAAAGRLAHLQGLGVTHVELMPLAAFDGTHGWGYDGVAIDAVHEPYGGPDALCRFVDAAHAQGLAVLLDVVHNHLGPSGNPWDRYGPFVTDGHSTPWGGAVNLDAPGSDDVRHILVSSALAWLRDFHLDGLRLDAVHALRDDRAVPYLQELSAAVAGLSAEVGRPLTLVAETDRNDPATVQAADDGGLAMTAQWDDDVHHALHWLLTGETQGYYEDFGSCGAVAHALERGFLHDGRWSSFRCRTHGRPVDWATTDPWRLVVALQTHDQVGNRACGERLSALVDEDRLACGAALLLTLPYTPMLFMGEEWGARTPWRFFTSFTDPAVAQAVTTGRRTEFGGHGWGSAEVPDPQARETYEASRLDWSEPGRRPPLLRWYADLVALRRSEPGLGPAGRSDSATADGLHCSWDEAPDGRASWFLVARGDWRTVVNLGAEARQVELGRPVQQLVLAWRDGAEVGGSSGSTLALDAGAAAVVRVSPLGS